MVHCIRQNICFVKCKIVEIIVLQICMNLMYFNLSISRNSLNLNILFQLPCMYIM